MTIVKGAGNFRRGIISISMRTSPPTIRARSSSLPSIRMALCHHIRATERLSSFRRSARISKSLRPDRVGDDGAKQYRLPVFRRYLRRDPHGRGRCCPDVRGQSQTSAGATSRASWHIRAARRQRDRLRPGLRRALYLGLERRRNLERRRPALQQRLRLWPRGRARGGASRRDLACRDDRTDQREPDQRTPCGHAERGHRHPRGPNRLDFTGNVTADIEVERVMSLGSRWQRRASAMSTSM